MPTTPRLKVTVNADGTIDTAHRIVRETTPFVNRAKRVVELTDVDATGTPFANGDTLVYNAASGKFEIGPLGLGDVLPFEDVDGGTF